MGLDDLISLLCRSSNSDWGQQMSNLKRKVYYIAMSDFWRGMILVVSLVAITIMFVYVWHRQREQEQDRQKEIALIQQETKNTCLRFVAVISYIEERFRIDSSMPGVSPEIIAKRRAAIDRMEDSIIKFGTC